eukprot:4334037-Lingulodinium_polyedra.AAC.1
MVERRQALLRDQLHKVDTQFRVEELDVPFNTPYVALYGRAPNMFPSLSLSEVAADDSTGTL